MKKVILITICFLVFFGFSNLYGVTQSENNPPKNTNQKQTNENKETKKNPGKASIPDYQEEVGIILNDDDSYEGYTLFAPKHFTTTYLIDNEGNVLHSWESDYEPGQSVYLLENGNLIRACFTKNKNFGAGGEGGRIEEYDWDSNLVWSFDYSNEEHMIHHDIEILPNGNILGIVWEKKSYSEAIAAGRNPDLLPDGELWPDYIVEIEKDGTDNGNIVWEWHIWDHIIQDFDQSKDNYGIVSNHPELADINYWAETGSPAHANWNHVNSIDYNPDLDQVMISVRGFSEVWIIDHSTTTEEAESSTGGNSGKGGDILYRWGNPQAYKMGTKQDQILFQQHDPQWIEQDLPGEGNIIVFNNGPEREYSTVEEFNVPEQDKKGNYPLS